MYVASNSNCLMSFRSNILTIMEHKDHHGARVEDIIDYCCKSVKSSKDKKEILEGKFYQLYARFLKVSESVCIQTT